MRIDKRLAGIPGLVLVLLMAAGLAPAGEVNQQLCLPLDGITLSAPNGVKAQRNAVEFPHGLHLSFACTDCHHKWTGTAENLDCTTSGCHDLVAAPEKGSGIPDHRYFKNAYHASCIGCHKQIKTANRSAELANTVATAQQPGGPTGCVECHSR